MPAALVKRLHLNICGQHRLMAAPCSGSAGARGDARDVRGQGSWRASLKPESGCFHALHSPLGPRSAHDDGGEAWLGAYILFGTESKLNQ